MFKIGKALPLYKSGSHAHPGNYRLITLLPAINTVYEKLLFNRLSTFFEKYNIIKDNQYGFRPKHSTELAITKFYEDVLNTLNNNQSCAAILLDLSKAFDSVDRKILLYKLYAYGIRGPPYKLLESYLNNRKQYIHTNCIQSNQYPANYGVPQGSIISTLFFLIMINDIKNSTALNVLNFADDTLLYHEINTTYSEIWLNNEFRNVNNWMDKNHLQLNLSKTNYLIFSHNRNKPTNIKLSTNNNQQIKQVTNCKYLGMTMDSKLNWKLHIEKTENKVAKTIGIMYRIRNFLNKPSLKLIFYSLLFSHINYGILNYGRANKTALKHLSVLMNRALRCMNFLGRRDKQTKSIYYDEKILQLHDLFKLELGKFCFKFSKDLLPNSLNQILTNVAEVHPYDTRNSRKNFHRKKQSKGPGYTKIEYLGSKLWNDIPNEIKNSNSIHTFGRKYKFYLLQNYQIFG